MSSTYKISTHELSEFLKTLQARFEKNEYRHRAIKWTDVKARLEKNKDKVGSLWQMENTGGEPDVVDIDKKTGAFIFMDCCAESPKGRRSICYDPEALASRKEHKPQHSAMGMATEMNIEILTENEYLFLQKQRAFDLKTSSWIATPKAIRDLGGALFCDHRYAHTFVYHNGAESYYAARGFRGKLLV